MVADDDQFRPEPVRWNPDAAPAPVIVIGVDVMDGPGDGVRFDVVNVKGIAPYENLLQQPPHTLIIVAIDHLMF